MPFSWDPAKERANVARHGVDSRGAQGGLAERSALVLFYAGCSDHRELRWWLLGRVGARILLVRYTHRPGGTIRLIGAGYWRQGRNYYENYWKQT